MPFGAGYTRTKTFAAAGTLLPGDLNSIQDDLGGQLANAVQPGDAKFSFRATPPTGWLLADGTAVSRVTYADLYAALGGAAWAGGQGDGSTTFNLPDMRGRTAVGEDGAAARLTANDLRGQAGGAEKHQLTVAELASHGHGYTGAQTVATVNAGSAVNVANAFSGSTDTAGSGTPHNNMQPYQVGNWFVKI